MIPIPDPLHPAVVHFPIVLILAGTVCAVAAVFVRRWHLPLLTALVLAAGALGSVAAVVTGEQDEDMVGKLSASADHVLEEHEEWGKQARNVALVSALLAVGAAATCRMRVAGRTLSALAAAAALTAAYSVAQAGHYGGQLVYHHGVGIKTAAATGGEASAPAIQGDTHKAPHDDD